jgi:hypothetical protein
LTQVQLIAELRGIDAPAVKIGERPDERRRKARIEPSDRRVIMPMRGRKFGRRELPSRRVIVLWIQATILDAR